MGLGGTYRLGEDFKVIIWGGKLKSVGTIFYWESGPLEIPCKDFHLAIEEGLGWMKWLKMGQRKFQAIFLALYPFW